MLSGRVSRSRACRTCSGVRAGGRPRRWPRAFAAARPSWVPWMMSSRMYSASALKTWKTSRPPGGGGVECFVQGAESDAALAEFGDDRDQVGQGSREPVEAGDDEGVAGSEEVEAGGELGSVGGLAGLLVSEDPKAAGFVQGEALAVEDLVGA